MSPPSFANGLIGIESRGNFHRREKPLFLPLAKAVLKKVHVLLLASNVVGDDGTVVPGGACIAGFFVDASFDPSNAAEAARAEFEDEFRDGTGGGAEVGVWEVFDFRSF